MFLLHQPFNIICNMSMGFSITLQIRRFRGWRLLGWWHQCCTLLQNLLLGCRSFELAIDNFHNRWAILVWLPSNINYKLQYSIECALKIRGHNWCGIKCGDNGGTIILRHLQQLGYNNVINKTTPKQRF